MNRLMKFPARNELTDALGVFRKEFLAVGLFSMTSNLLMLVPTVYMLQIYDRVLVSHSEFTLLAVSLVALFLFSIGAFTDWSRSRVLVSAGVRFDELLNTRVFDASFENYLNPAGANPARAFSDLTGIRQFLTGPGIFAFFDAPWTPFYIGALFMLHPMLGATALVFLLIQVALTALGHRLNKAPTRELIQAQRADTSFLDHKLRNVEIVESMGMLTGLHERWWARHHEYLIRLATSQQLTQRITALGKFIRYSQQSLTLAVGALLVIDGQISPGAMIAANVLMTRALAPIDALMGGWRGFISAQAAFKNLAHLLSASTQDTVSQASIAPPTGRVDVVNITASAPGRPKPILQGVSLSARPGTVTVILGPSGSGKSTLARVMLGIWPDYSGEVRLDQQPITRWNRDQLGPHLGYVPQDVELFNGTVAENIARFAEVDSGKVVAAAKSAELHDLILRLPKGYDTPVGEAGASLSAGLKQRLALARALYGEPALIVMDEPNANLDDVGDQALAKAIRELKSKQKTLVLITHRPGLIELADVLVILKDGQVLANGPRDQVLTEMRTRKSPH